MRSGSIITRLHGSFVMFCRSQNNHYSIIINCLPRPFSTFNTSICRSQASKLKRYKFYLPIIHHARNPQLGNQTNIALWWETCHSSSNIHFSNQIHPSLVPHNHPEQTEPISTLVCELCSEYAIIPACLLTDNPNDILGFPSRRRPCWISTTFTKARR